MQRCLSIYFFSLESHCTVRSAYIFSIYSAILLRESSAILYRFTMPKQHAVDTRVMYTKALLGCEIYCFYSPTHIMNGKPLATAAVLTRWKEQQWARERGTTRKLPRREKAQRKNENEQVAVGLNNRRRESSKSAKKRLARFILVLENLADSQSAHTLCNIYIASRRRAELQGVYTQEEQLKRERTIVEAIARYAEKPNPPVSRTRYDIL